MARKLGRISSAFSPSQIILLKRTCGHFLLFALESKFKQKKGTFHTGIAPYCLQTCGLNQDKNKRNVSFEYSQKLKCTALSNKLPLKQWRQTKTGMPVQIQASNSTLLLDQWTIKCNHKDILTKATQALCSKCNLQGGLKATLSWIYSTWTTFYGLCFRFHEAFINVEDLPGPITQYSNKKGVNVWVTPQ